MYLKSSRYGARYLKSSRYLAVYGARLTENNVELQVYFCGADAHRKSIQGARNIVHQNFKFFEPSAWFLILFHLTYMKFSRSTHLLMCLSLVGDF